MAISEGIRISYMESGIPNVVVSRQVFIVGQANGGNHYKAYINLAEKKFFIRNERTSEILLQGEASSPHKLKIKAKDALTKLGVIFKPEERAEKKNSNSNERGE